MLRQGSNHRFPQKQMHCVTFHPKMSQPLLVQNCSCHSLVPAVVTLQSNPIVGKRFPPVRNRSRLVCGGVARCPWRGFGSRKQWVFQVGWPAGDVIISGRALNQCSFVCRACWTVHSLITPSMSRVINASKLGWSSWSWLLYSWIGLNWRHRPISSSRLLGRLSRSPSAESPHNSRLYFLLLWFFFVSSGSKINSFTGWIVCNLESGRKKIQHSIWWKLNIWVTGTSRQWLDRKYKSICVYYITQLKLIFCGQLSPTNICLCVCVWWQAAERQHFKLFCARWEVFAFFCPRTRLQSLGRRTLGLLWCTGFAFWLTEGGCSAPPSSEDLFPSQPCTSLSWRESTPWNHISKMMNFSHLSNNSGQEPHALNLVMTFANVLFGLPSNGYILWLIASGPRGKLIREFFQLNLSIFEVLHCTIGITYFAQYFRLTVHLTNGLYKNLMWSGRPLLQCCICLEHFVAVVHPVLYLRYRSHGVKAAVAAAAWAFILSFILFYVLLNHYTEWVLATGCITFMSVMLFCYVCIFAVLRKPRPGEGRGKRDRSVKSKSICFITVILVSFSLGYLMWSLNTLLKKVMPSFIYARDFRKTCNLIITICGLVQPLMYLQRRQKCFWRKTSHRVSPHGALVWYVWNTKQEKGFSFLMRELQNCLNCLWIVLIGFELGCLYCTDSVHNLHAFIVTKYFFFDKHPSY